jgi:hypothetical protein
MSVPRFLADEDLRQDILDATLRQAPAMQFQRVTSEFRRAVLGPNCGGGNAGEVSDYIPSDDCHVHLQRVRRNLAGGQKFLIRHGGVPTAPLLNGAFQLSLMAADYDQHGHHGRRDESRADCDRLELEESSFIAGG